MANKVEQISSGLLDEIREYLDNRADVRDGSYGESFPNEAMSLCSRLDSEREKNEGLCIRWGHGEDRCVRMYDHIGECQDAKGNTIESVSEEAGWLSQKREARNDSGV